MVVDAPGFRSAKVLGNLLEHVEVNIRGLGGKFAKCNDSIANVGSASDISKQQFSK